MTAQDLSTRPQAAKLTVDDFLMLDEAGAFAEYSRSELIDGTIYVVNAEHSPHFKMKNRLYRRLADVCDALGGGQEAWSDGSVAFRPHSMPEPDIFVTSEEPGDPIADISIVLLAVEIASTSLAYDLGKKRRLYAAAGVPEYWVIDVEGRVIHKMWVPAGDDYRERDTTPLGVVIAAATIPGLSVETGGL